jgi:hypothetical protein
LREQHDPTADVKSADRESDSFIRGVFVTVGSNASVVADEGVRDELFGALDVLVDGFGTALEEALTKQAGEGATLTVSDPYSLDVRPRRTAPRDQPFSWASTPPAPSST